MSSYYQVQQFPCCLVLEECRMECPRAWRKSQILWRKSVTISTRQLPESRSMLSAWIFFLHQPVGASQHYTISPSKENA